MISFLSNVQCLMCSDIYAFYKNQAHWGTTQGFPNRFAICCILVMSIKVFQIPICCTFVMFIKVFKYPFVSFWSFSLRFPNTHFLYFLSFSLRFSKYLFPTFGHVHSLCCGKI